MSSAPAWLTGCRLEQSQGLSVWWSQGIIRAYPLRCLFFGHFLDYPEKDTRVECPCASELDPWEMLTLQDYDYSNLKVETSSRSQHQAVVSTPRYLSEHLAKRENPWQLAKHQPFCLPSSLSLCKDCLGPVGLGRVHNVFLFLFLYAPIQTLWIWWPRFVMVVPVW